MGIAIAIRSKKCQKYRNISIIHEIRVNVRAEGKQRAAAWGIGNIYFLPCTRTEGSALIHHPRTINPNESKGSCRKQENQKQQNSVLFFFARLFYLFFLRGRCKLSRISVRYTSKCYPRKMYVRLSYGIIFLIIIIWVWSRRYPLHTFTSLGALNEDIRTSFPVDFCAAAVVPLLAPFVAKHFTRMLFSEFRISLLLLLATFFL